MQQEETLTKTAATLAQLTGMSVTIYDAHLHALYGCNTKNPNPCDELHTCAGCYEKCFASDIAAKRTVDEGRDVYAYTCPFGLVEFLMPIFDHGKIEGYLMMGKALEAGEASLQKAHQLMAELFEKDDERKSAALDKLNLVPRLSADDMDACIHLLRVFAAHIEDCALFPGNRMSLGEMVRNLIKRNYHTKLTLSMLALELHCSTVTLTEAFRREYGITIMQYVNELRMEQAERLLRESSTSVSQVAEHCGFPDAGYFTRRFTAAYGMSPSAYRKQWQKDKRSTSV